MFPKRTVFTIKEDATPVKKALAMSAFLSQCMRDDEATAILLGHHKTLFDIFLQAVSGR